MPDPEIQMSEPTDFHHTQKLTLTEGVTQIVVKLPKPVPEGQQADVRVRIDGEITDAK